MYILVVYMSALRVQKVRANNLQRTRQWHEYGENKPLIPDLFLTPSNRKRHIIMKNVCVFFSSIPLCLYLVKPRRNKLRKKNRGSKTHGVAEMVDLLNRPPPPKKSLESPIKNYEIPGTPQIDLVPEQLLLQM